MAFTDIIDNIHIHIIGQEKWLVWSIIYSVLHMLLENVICLKSTTKLTKEIIVYNYMYIYIWVSMYINRGRIASHSQNKWGQMARCLFGQLDNAWPTQAGSTTGAWQIWQLGAERSTECTGKRPVGLKQNYHLVF